MGFLVVVDSQVVVGLLPEVVEGEEDEGQEEVSATRLMLAFKHFQLFYIDWLW